MLSENEAYRNECIRLRERLEQALRQQPPVNTPSSMEATHCGQDSATDTFKRDTHMLSLQEDKEKDSMQRQNEQLITERQKMIVRMAQQEQAIATQNLES